MWKLILKLQRPLLPPLLTLPLPTHPHLTACLFYLNSYSSVMAELSRICWFERLFPWRIFLKEIQSSISLKNDFFVTKYKHHIIVVFFSCLKCSHQTNICFLINIKKVTLSNNFLFLISFF